MHFRTGERHAARNLLFVHLVEADHHRRQDRDADGPAKVPADREQARRVGHPFRRQRAERQVRSRHHGKDQARAPQGLWPEQFVEAGLGRQMPVQPCADGGQRQAHGHDKARIIALGHRPGDRPADEHGETGDTHHLTDLEGRVSPHLPQIERQQENRTIKPKAHDGGDDRARGKVPVLEHAQIHQRNR